MRPGLQARISTRLGVWLPVLMCAACIGHVNRPYQPEVSGAAVSAVGINGSGLIYPYDSEPPRVSNSDLDEYELENYHVKHLAFDSVSRNGQRDDRVDVLWYVGRSPGAKPAVIVLPIWGSYTYPPNRIAAGLRNLGGGNVNILHLQGASRVLDWEALSAAPDQEAFLDLMAKNTERIRSNAIDVSRLVDWAVTRPEIDPQRIGLVGFSHSGITASLLAANDDRLAAIVIVMAGARPHRVFASCRGHVGELRESVTHRFSWSVEEYQDALEPLMRYIDAARYTSRTDPSRILVFDAERDACFPQDSREAMWKALGKPERYTIAYGHKISFLAMTPFGLNWMRRPVYDFLDRHLLITGQQ